MLPSSNGRCLLTGLSLEALLSSLDLLLRFLSLLLESLLLSVESLLLFSRESLRCLLSLDLSLDLASLDLSLDLFLLSLSLDRSLDLESLFLLFFSLDLLFLTFSFCFFSSKPRSIPSKRSISSLF